MTCDGHIRRSCAYRLSLSPYFFKNCACNAYHLGKVRGKGKWQVGMSYSSLLPKWDLPYIVPASRNGMVWWFICGVNISLIILKDPSTNRAAYLSEMHSSSISQWLFMKKLLKRPFCHRSCYHFNRLEFLTERLVVYSLTLLVQVTFPLFFCLSSYRLESVEPYKSHLRILDSVVLNRVWISDPPLLQSMLGLITIRAGVGA